MANYIKATNFTAKDALPSGNAGKIIKGTEIDVEFSAIATAVSSKTDANSPTFTGTPLAPTANSGTNNTQIATTAFVTAAAAAAFPTGGILLWSGSIASIPAGFVLCNGSNNTPDLRDRFVVGAGSAYAVNDTGGSNDSTLPTHTHTATSTVTDPSHFHTTTFRTTTKAGDGPTRIHGPEGSQSSNDTLNTNSKTTGITVGTTNANAGTSGVGTNRPPFYALAYIMKT